ncbi:MAG: hypothetical protein FJ118_07345 [Deltaproteobacteria bacterium]|nr:hypothetical protein [Deltaproteobacteria bacterium]
MFQITKQAQGRRGAFVKVVQLEGEDFAVIVRYPDDGRYHQKYIGPDLFKAEEIYAQELEKISSAGATD